MLSDRARIPIGIGYALENRLALSRGTGSLLVDGSGLTVLSGNNTYTGATTLNGGTVQAGVASVVTPGAIVNNMATAPATADQRWSAES